MNGCMSNNGNLQVSMINLSGAKPNSQYITKPHQLKTQLIEHSNCNKPTLSREPNQDNQTQIWAKRRSKHGSRARPRSPNWFCRKPKSNRTPNSSNTQTTVTKPSPEQNPDIQTQYLIKTQISNHVLTAEKLTQITEQDGFLQAPFLGKQKNSQILHKCRNNSTLSHVNSKCTYKHLHSLKLITRMLKRRQTQMPKYPKTFTFLSLESVALEF